LKRLAKEYYLLPILLIFIILYFTIRFLRPLLEDAHFLLNFHYR